jgi:hypothetical protein
MLVGLDGVERPVNSSGTRAEVLLVRPLRDFEQNMIWLMVMLTNVQRATWFAVVCLGKGQKLVLLEKRCATASPNGNATQFSRQISPESHSTTVR